MCWRVQVCRVLRSRWFATEKSSTSRRMVRPDSNHRCRQPPACVTALVPSANSSLQWPCCSCRSKENSRSTTKSESSFPISHALMKSRFDSSYRTHPATRIIGPQDYVMPMMLQPVTAMKILDMWARKPLDFDPGTKWQYSNTNYVIAGVIIEKVS